jgi:hypothetical protein
MFVVARLPSLPLSIISGVFLLSVSCNPSAAQVADRVVEMIATEAAVLSTVHYQAELTLQCGANSCAGNFPRPGAKRRLNITRITCLLQATSTYDRGWIALRAADGSHRLYQFLPADFVSPSSSIVINRAVDVQIISLQYIRVDLRVEGDATSGTCTATGTLDTLQ